MKIKIKISDIIDIQFDIELEIIDTYIEMTHTADNKTEKNKIRHLFRNKMRTTSCIEQRRQNIFSQVSTMRHVASNHIFHRIQLQISD